MANAAPRVAWPLAGVGGPRCPRPSLGNLGRNRAAADVVAPGHLVQQLPLPGFNPTIVSLGAIGGGMAQNPQETLQSATVQPRPARLSTPRYELLDATPRLRHHASLIRHPCRVVNRLENASPELQKPALKAGLNIRRGRRNSLSGKPEFPRSQALSQAKTLFSLTGGFVPIFGPFAAGCNPKGAANAEPCPMPTPSLPGLRGTAEDLCRLAGLVRQHDQGNQLPAHAEEGRDASCGIAPATSTGRRGARTTTAEPWDTAALQVLHALIFDFLNYASGRLDPSYAAIARKANVCERTVAQRAHSGSRRLASSIGCGVAPRAGRTAASCWSRRRTPMPCCRASQWRGYTRAAGGPAAHAGHMGRSSSPALCVGAGGHPSGRHGGTMRDGDRDPRHAIRRTRWRQRWRGSAGRCRSAKS